MSTSDYRPPWEAGTDISPEQTELATRLRIPFLSSPYPRWNYITGIVVSDLYQGIVPTEDEVTVVAGFLREYCDRWYYAHFCAQMERFAPYDIDGGANLSYFIKFTHGGWAYRKRTWTSGPSWVPEPNQSAKTIEQVLDQLRSR